MRANKAESNEVAQRAAETLALVQFFYVFLVLFFQTLVTCLCTSPNYHVIMRGCNVLSFCGAN